MTNFIKFGPCCAVLILFLSFTTTTVALDVDNLITFSIEKYNILSSTVPESGRYISTGNPLSDTWSTTGPNDWTVGFYAGSLWMLYKFSNGDTKWKDLAEINQHGLIERQFDRQTHDVGFVIMSSFGHGLELIGNEEYTDIIIQAAISLSGRFFRLGGVLRSWNNGIAGEGEVKVIVDNMMNLNLLFKASELTGNPLFRDIAISHADKTIEEHIRLEDGSTFHVVAYNETTGQVHRKYTAQGYADNSTWARGQAWGMLGFVETYKNTNNSKYLSTAEQLSTYFIANLPDDYVPFWDFNVPIDNGYQPRDTSAAAIASCALLELYLITGRSVYFDVSDLILNSLSSAKYRSDGIPTYRIPSILVNGTVFKNQNDFDTAITYGDYYFLRAIDLYRQINTV